MKVYVKEVTLSTRSAFELVDITHHVGAAVEESGVKNGVCLVFAPHATAAIIANEHELGLMDDMLTLIKRLYPRGAGWKHDRIDDNAHAHLGSALIGADRVFPVVNGRLVRGTWQNIFLVEMDGPRSRRRILIEIMGE